jgi:TonB family protein
VIGATVVLLAAHMIIPRLRSWSAAQRHLLWAASLATAAALPLLGLLLGAWQPEWAVRIGDAWPSSFGVLKPWASLQGADVIVRTTGVEAASWDVSRRWLPMWMAGACVALVLLVRDVARLIRLARGAEPLIDPRCTELCRACARQLGLSRAPALFVSRRAVIPMTWGVRRPRVLLPATALGWSADRLRAVLAHEIGHIARADWLVHLFAQLACAVYWFHPMFWTAERALGRETELAADDEALGVGLEASQYAADMMEIVRASRLQISPRSPVVAMARAPHLERRIAALLQPNANRAPVSRRVAAVAASVSLVIVLPLAAITTGDAIDVDVRAVGLPISMQTSNAAGPEPAAPTVRAGQGRGAAAAVAAPSEWTSLPAIEEYTTPPLYSDEARRRGIEGIVTIAFRVDERGHVSGGRVVNGLGFGLDQNALVALRQWRFRPGRRNGTPAAMDAEVDIEFSLRSEGVNELIANDMATLVGPGVTPPRVVRTSRVPLRAGDANGLVVLDVVLQQDGTPRIVRILRSLTPEADESAVRHFEQWRFSPAMKDGVAVKVRMNAEVRFRDD